MHLKIGTIPIAWDALTGLLRQAATEAEDTGLHDKGMGPVRLETLAELCERIAAKAGEDAAALRRTQRLERYGPTPPAPRTCAYPQDTAGEHDHDACTDALG